MPLEVGQVASDYEVLSLLGKGGMGRVYRVRNVISNRIEAMKVLLANVEAEAELGDRFLAEIRTLARLDHPNIAKFLTAFKFENQLVMVMEYVEGFSLAERAKQGPIPLEEVLSFTTQTLAALGYAHQAGVIHRDIKPANIMVTPHGVVKLMDFGIAKSTLDPGQTRPGTTMGSMLYMSPEQVRGTTVDARSDIYSVGILLYELTAGRRPFEAENTFSILEAQLNTPPRPPIEVNPALPPALNEIILTALDKEPMRRFQSADAFRKALESVRVRAGSASQQQRSATVVQRTQPPPPPPPSALAPPPRRSNRGLWMALGALVCVGALIGGAVALPHFWKSSAATKTESVVAAPVSQTPVVQTPPVQTPVVAPPPATAPQTAPVTATPHKAITPVRPAAEPVNQLQQAPPPVVTPQTQAVVAPPPPAGPSQEQIDQVSEDLMKLHARADAIRGSLDHLRSQQAADGLSINPAVASGASRMDTYLQASDRALQSNNLDSARKNMEHADAEVTKLEAFFGR